MNQEVLEHLCEAYLYWTLYTSDFISLLQVDEAHAEEFWQRLFKRYEDRQREQHKLRDENSLRWFEYEQWWKEYAKFLLAMIREREKEEA